MPEPILLVEDDDSLRSTVARYLRLRGYAVLEADSAEQARERLATGPRPGLVLLDLNLPGDTGWELLRDGPLASGEGPPVVIVSAIPVGHRQLAEHRVAGYLPKPFPLDTLVSTVERTLNPPPATDEP
jgi:two-component system, OmpR family, response regulator